MAKELFEAVQTAEEKAEQILQQALDRASGNPNVE